MVYSIHVVNEQKDIGPTNYEKTRTFLSLQVLPPFGVKPMLHLKLSSSHHTYNIRVFGLMKGNLQNLCQLSSNGLNLIRETSKCILS